MTGGNRLITFMQKAAQEYTRQTGGDNISTYCFTSQTQEEGFGSDFHPSEATQTRCALEFTKFLREKMGKDLGILQTIHCPIKQFIPHPLLLLWILRPDIPGKQKA